MKYETQAVENVLIISIEGEIMGGADEQIFRQLIFDSIQDDILNVVVDLEKATWMNSSGLGMLISGLTTLRSSGGDLCLVKASERIRRPIEITKLNTVFSFYNSIDEATKSFNN